MAVKGIFWSCFVVLVAYFAYHELNFVTIKISVEKFIPAKRSDVFQLLFDKPEVSAKFHPLCTDVSNIVKYQDEEGHRTVQLDYEEAVVFFGFYKKTVEFQITAKALEENSVIVTTANLTGGYFQINQNWVLSDSKNGEEDGTLLEDHFTFTTPLILARLAKPKAQGAHTGLLENIWRHFQDIKETNYK